MKQQQLKEKLGTLAELFGHLTSTAGDLSTNLENSLTSAQYPGREAFLGQVLARDHDPAPPLPARVQRGDEYSANRPQAPVERQLPQEPPALQRGGRDLLGRGQERERDRQVESAALLWQLGGREVQRDAGRRHLEPRVAERRLNSFLGLPDREIRKPHDLGVG